MSTYKVVSDEYISTLFKGKNFGEKINSSVAEQRRYIAKSLRQQLEGYWSGHTMYHILVDGGFLVDAKTNEEKKLTALGKAFLEAEQFVEQVGV